MYVCTNIVATYIKPCFLSPVCLKIGDACVCMYVHTSVVCFLYSSAVCFVDLVVLYVLLIPFCTVKPL